MKSAIPLVLAACLLVGGCATKKAAHPTPAGAITGAPPTGATGSPGPSPTPAPKKAPSLTKFLPWKWPSAISGLIVKKKSGPPRAGLPQLVGVVKMVNKDDQFVLIDAYAFQGVQPGDALICLADQRETANLRLSTLRNPPFLIGDITSGSPSPGERVYKP